MTDVEPLMVDELRQAFRLARPPRRATLPGWQAGIFRLTTPARQIGYRIFWFPDHYAQPLNGHQLNGTFFELLEILDQ